MSKAQSNTATADAQEKQIPLLPAKMPKGKPARVPMTEFKGMVLTGPKPDAGFLATVDAMGVIEPVILFKPAEGRLKIGDGIRRIKAAQITEKADIPAVIFEDEENFRLACTLVLNNQRSANPLAEVRAIMRFQRKGFGISQITEATKLPKVRVEERLRLNNLIKPLYDSMFKGQIAVSIGAAACRLPNVFQKQLAAKLKKEGHLTQKDVKEVKEVRRDAAVAALPKAIFADPPKAPAELNGKERELLSLFIQYHTAPANKDKKALDAMKERIDVLVTEVKGNGKKEKQAVNA